MNHPRRFVLKLSIIGGRWTQGVGHSEMPPYDLYWPRILQGPLSFKGRVWVKGFTLLYMYWTLVLRGENVDEKGQTEREPYYLYWTLIL